MDFSKLNQVSRLENFLPTKSWNELKDESLYPVTSVKRVNTKFGQSIIATINDEFNVFLPKRITEFLLKDDNVYNRISEASTNSKLTIHYIGGKYHQCEFQYEE
ncbi:hypothetical protein PV325_012470 [Microctonus aethiopoides]|nr:hypothetical protein PV326_001090 [Microctonus aethiopoides]KAK0071695.1 hypothetical protein PV325_012470 [Microctonus aethiopoides]